MIEESIFFYRTEIMFLIFLGVLYCWITFADDTNNVIFMNVANLLRSIWIKITTVLIMTAILIFRVPYPKASKTELYYLQLII